MCIRDRYCPAHTPVAHTCGEHSKRGDYATPALMSTSAISCGPRAAITPGAGPYASGDSLRLRTALNTLSAISSGLRSSVTMYTSAARRDESMQSFCSCSLSGPQSMSLRRAADVYILTDDLSPDEIAERVLRAVRNRSESPEA